MQAICNAASQYFSKNKIAGIILKEGKRENKTKQNPAFPFKRNSDMTWWERPSQIKTHSLFKINTLWWESCREHAKASPPAATEADAARSGSTWGHLGGMFSTGLQEMMQKEVYSCVHLVEEMYAAGTGLSQKPGPSPLLTVGRRGEGIGGEESFCGNIFKIQDWM